MRSAAQGHPLSAQILAPQKSEFFLDMIAQPIAPFETLRSNFFHLANRLKMHLNVHAPPTVIAETNDILNRGMLLLRTRIHESLCDRALREIKRVGETERHEVSGKTSEILNAVAENRF